MAILDIIQYTDDSGQNLATRVGPSTVNMGSQLIVRESQAAVFFRDGKAYDTFGPGRHMLTTQNIPLLGAIMRIPNKGDAYIEYGGLQYTLIESAGPAWLPPGTIASETLAMLQANDGAEI